MCEDECIPYEPDHPQVLTSRGFEVDEGILEDIELLIRGTWVTQYSCQGEKGLNHRYIVVERKGEFAPHPAIFDWCKTMTYDTWDGVGRAMLSGDDDFTEDILAPGEYIVWTREEGYLEHTNV